MNRALETYIRNFAMQMDRCDTAEEVEALFAKEAPNRIAIKITTKSDAGIEIMRIREASLAKIEAAAKNAASMGAG